MMRQRGRGRAGGGRGVGWWEGRDRTATKGNRTGRVDDDDYNYSPTQPDSEAAVLSSDFDPAIPFAFRGKEAVATAVGYTKLVFAIFAQGYLLVLA